MSREFSDMDDKEFDEYLKRTSESPDIPFREEDWKLMKARIAAPNARSSASKWWRALAGLGILAILSLGIYLGADGLSKSSSEEQQVATASQDLKVGVDKDDMDITSPAAKRSSEEKEASVQGADLSDVPIPNSEMSTKVSVASVLSDSRKSGGENAGLLQESQKSQQTQVMSLTYRPDLSTLTPVTLGLKGLTSRSVVPWEERQPASDKTNKWFAGRLSLSVQAAPDLSGVELNRLGKAGQAVGLGVEYFISPSFSVNSGVFYFHKPYETNGHFQMGYGDQVNGVIGDCGILDLPANIRYYPLQGAVQRAFVGVGLSSYLMLSETYELTYKDPATGYEYTRTLKKKGENQHPFGVVNLSLGYERKLAQRLSLQVEPYLKVPLDGVGEGNISLKSTGIFLGLKYYPGR